MLKDQTVVLFGAGASYGAVDVRPYPPPLGKDLFNALCRYAPESWGQLPPATRDVFTNEGFEPAMAAMISGAPLVAHELQKAMGHYFLRFIPMSGCLYVKLAQRMRKSGLRPFLSTLNYERLLDKSLLRCGLRPFLDNYADPNRAQTDQLDPNSINLCHVHGAAHLIQTGILMKHGVTQRQFTTGGRGVERLINNWEISKFMWEYQYFPVMSFFAPGKPNQHGLGFLNEQRSRFERAVKVAAKIVIVGARILSSDAHLWRPLSTTAAGVHYYSPCLSDIIPLLNARNNALDQEHLGTFESKFEDLWDSISKPGSRVAG